MPVLAVNKRANFDYEILDKFEAGIVLAGHEVKSVKAGQVSLKGSFVTLKNVKNKKIPSVNLTNAHIAPYKFATLSGYEPTRPRGLLLKKSEIKFLVGKTQEQGLTLVPLKIYTKHSLVKLEFALARGKKKYDKREQIKKRELDRQERTLTKHRQLKITN